MNPSWGGKDRRPSARSSGRSICVIWHAALSSHSSWSDRVPAPKPAHGAPFTIHPHTIVASTTTRSATPRFMGTADGAGRTFSSHPALIADRGRRVRVPAIEGLRGKGVLRRIFASGNRRSPTVSTTRKCGTTRRYASAPDMLRGEEDSGPASQSPGTMRIVGDLSLRPPPRITTAHTTSARRTL
jgi:hypothetical protein